jgi:hypothetical protein
MGQPVVAVQSGLKEIWRFESASNSRSERANLRYLTSARHPHGERIALRAIVMQFRRQVDPAFLPTFGGLPVPESPPLISTLVDTAVREDCPPIEQVRHS